VCVADVVIQGRLRWLGHLACTGEDEWLFACRHLFVAGAIGRGRDKKIWEGFIELTLKSCRLMKEAAMDIHAWRGLNCPTRASMDKRMSNR